MGTAVLTEHITVDRDGDSHTLATVFPGPWDAQKLRASLGDPLYDAAVADGLIVEIP
jgi:hypothetical protein